MRSVLLAVAVAHAAALPAFISSTKDYTSPALNVLTYSSVVVDTTQTWQVPASARDISTGAFYAMLLHMTKTCDYKWGQLGARFVGDALEVSAVSGLGDARHLLGCLAPGGAPGYLVSLENEFIGSPVGEAFVRGNAISRAPIMIGMM